MTLNLMKHGKISFLNCISAPMLVLLTVIALVWEIASYIFMKKVFAFILSHILSPILLHIKLWLHGRSATTEVFLFNQNWSFKHFLILSIAFSSKGHGLQAQACLLFLTKAYQNELGNFSVIYSQKKYSVQLLGLFMHSLPNQLLCFLKLPIWKLGSSEYLSSISKNSPIKMV